MKRIWIAAAAFGVVAIAACETDTADSQDSFQTECSTAALDDGGKCRYADGRYASRSCCPGEQEIVVPTSLDLAELIASVSDGVQDHTFWEDEGVSCGAENVRGHEISGLLTDEYDHFIGLEMIVTADLPMPYCAGYGATYSGTCWVRLEKRGDELQVWDVECEEGEPYD